MRWAFRKVLPLIDITLTPLVYPAAQLLKLVRRIGVHRLPHCRRALMHVGVFPVQDHYYEPQFDYRKPRIDFDVDRHLPGIDLDVEGQLRLLQSLTYSAELLDLPKTKTAGSGFYLDNNAFVAGDAEYWYQIIRARKPKRLIEIGSGFSTLLAIEAIKMNEAEIPSYSCQHTCIEPYEMPWLESSGAHVLRRNVEEIDPLYFQQLETGDILFIDSSHVIRPQGDVLFEYLELLPSLQPGVIVHIHDIFSPKNYLAPWLQQNVKFWNEQYLLEAFLTHNKHWRVIGALNYLRHHHFDELQKVSPHLGDESEPGSFYIERVS